MKVGIVVFPGSNCDHDAGEAFGRVFKQDVTWLWHKDKDLKNVDMVFLPGGFSYGDYLRSGAIARFAPVMEEVIAFANGGGIVAGICNGFQILLEAGLLPGAMRRNAKLQFICDTVTLRLESTASKFTRAGEKGKTYRIPIAHHDGNYFIDGESLKKLKQNDQILFRYEDNPNGSVDDIAGICNVERNVFGMMPHPERCVEETLGNTDGRMFFDSLLK